MKKLQKPRSHLFEVKRQETCWRVIDITLLVETNERVEYAIYSANRLLQVGDVFWATLKQTEQGLYLEHTNVSHLEMCFSLSAYAKE